MLAEQIQHMIAGSATYYSGDCKVVRDYQGNLTVSKRSDGGEGNDNSGKMADNYAPWGDTNLPVTNVIIKEGVTSIGNRAFAL